ncbi:hypothetical protein AGOR_G00057900 [Albula goreensis]|uniref:Pyrin domain-containing protein n=1 Tax=Albula goreensis TaxID=1534307 RepID=A0A8T3DNP7_9TELE|nr:hypothetical protein AGOR_G00057900 [Albula goreensis]
MSLSGEPETSAGTSSPDSERVQVERAGSPVPSCLSMKSDNSMIEPIFLNEAFTGDPRVQVERAGSPAPSCLSMKSDNSMTEPIFFSGAFTGDPRVQQSAESSCLEEKTGQCTKKSLQRTLMKLKKEELKQFKNDLCQYYPECTERQQGDVDALHIVEKMLETCGSERSLKITLHILRNMKPDLANSPQRDEQKNESIRRAQQTLRDDLKKKFECIFEEEVLDEFDLKTYNTSAAGQQRLIPVVRNCRKAILDSCDLTEESCKIVGSALQSSNSPMRELDLSYNNLGYSGVKKLCVGLKGLNCKLQTLDLSFNNLGDSGVKKLFAELTSPNCKLQTLGLGSCGLTVESVEIVAAALQSSNSPLRKLNLSYNNLGDSGVKLLCAGLMSPNCKLQTLGLVWCNLTEGCCDDLASVLHSPHSELRNLELKDNNLQDSGVKVLSAGLEDPHCKLQRLGLSGCRVTERGYSGVRALSAAKLDTLTLLVDHGGESRNKPGPRKYGCQLTLDPNTAHRKLLLSEGNRKRPLDTDQLGPISVAVLSLVMMTPETPAKTAQQGHL